MCGCALHARAERVLACCGFVLSLGSSALALLCDNAALTLQDPNRKIL